MQDNVYLLLKKLLIYWQGGKTAFKCIEMEMHVYIYLLIGKKGDRNVILKKVGIKEKL